MAATPLRYRGIPYRLSLQVHASYKPADHVDRGIHYTAPLLQETPPVDQTLTICYRGVPYHQVVVSLNHLSSR